MKTKKEVGIIYGWYNTLTDMWYVGQTINPQVLYGNMHHKYMNY